MTRRQFLAATGGLVAAAALPGVLAGPAAAGRNDELSPLVLSSDLYASSEPQRFAFAIAKGARFASFKKARVVFAPPGENEGTVLATRLYKKGLPKGRGLYVVDATFPEAGVWNALVLTGGEEVPFAVDVKPAPEAPIVGAAASRAASPTPEQTLGVQPLCTRRPRCPLHDTSLDGLIGAGAPVAVMFATPALCQSRYCGPVLDELLDVKDRYPNVRFHHVEIYRSNRGNELAPTVEAWGLLSEPWLYTIDGSGVIGGRLDGAFGQDEITAALDRLAA